MTACKFVATDQPRVIPGRHGADCALASIEWPTGATVGVLGVPGASDGFACVGCLPCPEAHCAKCGTQHVNQLVCPGCVSDAREDLDKIRDMCTRLRTEVATKGLASEAMNLLGPVPDPEARHHAESSYRAGRLPEGWLETGRHGKECPLLVNEPCTGCGGSDRHPLTIAWWWNECYREALDHDETPAIRPAVRLNGEYDAGFGLADLLAYLDRNLSYVAQLTDVPFQDFAQDLSGCRKHLEDVLCDGERPDTGAPCMNCRVPLERVWGSSGGEDAWECPRCHDVRTEAEYRQNLAQQMHVTRAERVENAPWLSDVDMEFRFGVKAATVRKRAERGDVKRKWHSGALLYRVSDMPEAEVSRPVCYPVTDGAQEVPQPEPASHQAAGSFVPEQNAGRQSWH